MKKNLWIVLVLILVMSLAGCGSKSTSEKDEKKDTTQEGIDKPTDSNPEGSEEENDTLPSESEYPYVVENDWFRVNVKSGQYVAIDGKFDGRDGAYQISGNSIVNVPVGDENDRVYSTTSVLFGIADKAGLSYNEYGKSVYDTLAEKFGERVSVEEHVTLGEKLPGIAETLADKEAYYVSVSDLPSEDVSTEYIIFAENEQIYKIMVNAVTDSDASRQLALSLVQAFELK